MNRAILLIIMVLTSVNCSADEVTIEVDDCGSLGQSDFGVAFRAKPHIGGQFYFAKGTAMEVCPKITKAKKIVGVVTSYCDYLEKKEPECKKVKVFTITNIINE